MFEIVLSKIWPEYKKLVDKSIDDETIRQMIKDMVEKGELDLPKEASGNEGSRKKEKGKNQASPCPWIKCQKKRGKKLKRN